MMEHFVFCNVELLTRLQRNLLLTGQSVQRANSSGLMFVLNKSCYTCKKGAETNCGMDKSLFGLQWFLSFVQVLDVNMKTTGLVQEMMHNSFNCIESKVSKPFDSDPSDRRLCSVSVAWSGSSISTPPGWEGCPMTRLPAALNSLVRINNVGWKEALWEYSVFSKKNDDPSQDLNPA